MPGRGAAWMRKKIENNAAGGSYKAPAVGKAFELLRLVAGARQGLGLSELAAKLGYSKSTTHGLVHALIHEGALVQANGGKKLLLGSTVVELAFQSWNYLIINREAQPILDELKEKIGESVFLGVLNRSNARAIIMATSEATKPLKISSPPGTTISLFAGAVGKVFLAGMEDAQALALIREKGLPRFTENSIVSEQALMGELARVRERGWALDDEEYIPGVRAVAASIGNLHGLPLALWVVGFAGNMGDSEIEKITQATLAATEKLHTVLDAAH
jgi:DNA-binding IclR family transcriptional regulator